MPRTAIPLPLDLLTDFCRRHGIVRLEVFGSILRDDFGPESDIDFLYTFAGPAPTHSLFDVTRMEIELAELLGRPVDLVSRRGLELTANQLRRDAILGTAETLIALPLAA